MLITFLDWLCARSFCRHALPFIAMKTPILILASFSVLASAFAQSSRTSYSSPKKRLTQAEWYRQKAKEDADRRAAIHDASLHKKGMGMQLNPCSFSSSERAAVDGHISSSTLYELPAVKKLGIKPPPRNRLKQDPYVPAQEQQRAKFLNEQASYHRKLTLRLVNFSRAFPRVSISSLVSDLNRISSSSAWKRMANSNLSPLFAGEEDRFRNSISCGLSSVDSSLSDLVYRATHNGSPQPRSIILGNPECDPINFPERWYFESFSPVDRRQTKQNIKIMRGYNDAARNQYIQDHPDDPNAYNFIAPKSIGSGGHVISNPDAQYDPLDHTSPPTP